jgi:hypothetical protein
MTARFCWFPKSKRYLVDLRPNHICPFPRIEGPKLSLRVCSVMDFATRASLSRLSATGSCDCRKKRGCVDMFPPRPEKNFPASVGAGIGEMRSFRQRGVCKITLSGGSVGWWDTAMKAPCRIAVAVLMR